MLAAHCTCSKRCNERVLQSDRERTYNAFIKMSFAERRLFLDRYIIQRPVKTKSNKENAKQRKYTFTYTLMKTSDQPTAEEETTTETTKVCKHMFLSTLGRKFDGFIMSHFKSKMKNNGLSLTEDKRGQSTREKATTMKVISESKIRQHIESFNPLVSHYRLINAPNRRYLTPDLSVKILWKDFIEKNNNSKVSYEKYRKIFIEANIGFSIPSEDDCPICSLYKNHHITDEHLESTCIPSTSTSTCTSEISTTNNTSSLVNIEDTSSCCSSSAANIHDENICDLCLKYNRHHNQYSLARQAYEDDKTKTWDANFNVYTADMQKVIIIPKMTIKNAYFVSRLVVFNETFASLHGSKDVCVLWNESVSGRRASDVASTYYNIIKKSNSEVLYKTY